MNCCQKSCCQKQYCYFETILCIFCVIETSSNYTDVTGVKIFGRRESRCQHKTKGVTENPAVLNPSWKQHKLLIFVFSLKVYLFVFPSRNAQKRAQLRVPSTHGLGLCSPNTISSWRESGLFWKTAKSRQELCKRAWGTWLCQEPKKAPWAPWRGQRDMGVKETVSASERMRLALTERLS